MLQVGPIKPPPGNEDHSIGREALSFRFPGYLDSQHDYDDHSMLFFSLYTSNGFALQRCSHYLRHSTWGLGFRATAWGRSVGSTGAFRLWGPG